MCSATLCDWTSYITARRNCRAARGERLRIGAPHKPLEGGDFQGLSLDFGDDQGDQAAAVMG